MTHYLIVGVFSEVVTLTHVLYCPPCQHIHVCSQTDQLVTQSLVAVIIRPGGGGGGDKNSRNITPQNGITYPVIEQLDTCFSIDWYFRTYPYREKVYGLVIIYYSNVFSTLIIY